MDGFEFQNSDSFKKLQKQLKKTNAFYDSHKTLFDQINSMDRLTEQQRNSAKQSFSALNKFEKENQPFLNKYNGAFSQTAKDAALSKLAKNSPYAGLAKGLPASQLVGNSPHAGLAKGLPASQLVGNSPYAGLTESSAFSGRWAKEMRNKASLSSSSSFATAMQKNVRFATSYNQVKNLIGSSNELLTDSQRANFKKLLSQQPFKDFYTQPSHATGEQTYDGDNHSDTLHGSKAVGENIARNPNNDGQGKNIVSKQSSSDLEDDIAEAKYYAENIPDDKLTSDDASLDITLFWVYIKTIFDLTVQIKGYYEAVQFLIGIFKWIETLIPH
ncbi:hypothetical protein [Levilactobacillus brevis]|uniref:hypothetical protein n=2 Tax=Levilactobacillus brevis TaxID=1580 RepID=UPI002074A336|nr:hypothetical protein [Levilactobacillus brevis]